MSGVHPGGIEDLNATVYPTGLANDFRITTMNVTDVAAPVPATALAARVALSITNLDAAEILYVGKSTVTANQALGITAGWEVGPGESFNIDIGSTLILYGRAEAGKTILVKILEVS